jgi:hypothetical protein
MASVITPGLDLDGLPASAETDLEPIIRASVVDADAFSFECEHIDSEEASISVEPDAAAVTATNVISLDAWRAARGR